MPTLDELAEKVRAERLAQGLPPELTDEQLDAIGAVWASKPRTRLQRTNASK